MKHRNVYIRKGGESMQWRNVGKAMYYLVAIVTLVSSLALFACGGDDVMVTSDKHAMSTLRRTWARTMPQRPVNCSPLPL